VDVRLSTRTVENGGRANQIAEVWLSRLLSVASLEVGLRGDLDRTVDITGGMLNVHEGGGMRGCISPSKKPPPNPPVRSVNGRDDWIRTSDPLTPSQVRYQAAPHPVEDP
jgi:hypothetical protein